MCASLLPPDERWADVFEALDVTRLARVCEVETVTLESFAREASIGPVDFIKMDIQGAELEALGGAGALLADVLFLVTEIEFVPMYVGQPLFGDVDAFLRARGFQFHKFLGLCGRTAKPLRVAGDPGFATQHMWSDAVFVRDPFRAAELAREQLLKTAVFLELYGSPDLALYFLRAADERGAPAIALRYFDALKRHPIRVR